VRGRIEDRGARIGVEGPDRVSHRALASVSSSPLAPRYRHPERSHEPARCDAPEHFHVPEVGSGDVGQVPTPRAEAPRSEASGRRFHLRPDVAAGGSGAVARTLGTKLETSATCEHDHASPHSARISAMRFRLASASGARGERTVSVEKLSNIFIAAFAGIGFDSMKLPVMSGKIRSCTFRAAAKSPASAAAPLAPRSAVLALVPSLPSPPRRWRSNKFGTYRTSGRECCSVTCVTVAGERG
jgi:hypothetical protein